MLPRVEARRLVAAEIIGSSTTRSSIGSSSATTTCSRQSCGFRARAARSSPPRPGRRRWSAHDRTGRRGRRRRLRGPERRRRACRRRQPRAGPGCAAAAGRTCDRVRDRVTGELVDNGQHVLFGCYHETFRFLRRVGAEDNVRLQSGLSIPFIDRRGAVRCYAVRRCRRRCICSAACSTGRRCRGAIASRSFEWRARS